MAKQVITENEAAVANAVSKTELFLEENKKLIWCVIAAVIVAGACAFLGYKYLYVPKQNEALAQMYKAEAAFAQDNFEIALKGDEGNIIGFEAIINEYGSKAGKAVYLYAATCELKLGNNDEALKYLGKYSTSDNIMGGRAEALKGDAYANKGEFAKAAACFEKAAKTSDNLFSAGYLVKAGLAYEALEQNEKALKAYNAAKDIYTDNRIMDEANEIEKYITRVEVK